jgi:hypothetical protein
MVLTVLPRRYKTTNVVNAESGMDKKTATVARRLARKIR